VFLQERCGGSPRATPIHIFILRIISPYTSAGQCGVDTSI
jgi:hypothetical protein